MASCTPVAAPASFRVSSFNISPEEITAGETTTISAIVENVGATTGVYNAAFTVDGARIRTQDVLLAPGARETIKFSLQRDKAGIYEIGIGDKRGKLTVKSELVTVARELMYDDGIPRDYIRLIKPHTGYLVMFEPSADQFILSQVRIFGLLFGGRGFIVRDVEVQIWDKDRNVLHTSTFPGKKFPLITYIGTNFEKLGAWADEYVPDIKVTGNFFVHVHTGIETGEGFRMGADDSIPNTHSDLTIRDATGIDTIPDTWPYNISAWYGDKSKVNWMVRVSGKALVPAE